MIFSRSIHIVANGSTFILLWLSSITLHIWTASSLSICLSMDTQIVSMSWLPGIMLHWTRGAEIARVGVFISIGHIPWSVIAGFCGSSVVNFWRTPVLLSIVAAPVHLLSISVGGFPFLHILARSGCLLSTQAHFWDFPLQKENQCVQDECVQAVCGTLSTAGKWRPSQYCW